MSSTASTSVRRRFAKLLNAKKEERNRLLLDYFYRLISKIFFIKPFHLNITLAYQPDFKVAFNGHPEFLELFKKFTANNHINNGGDFFRLWSFVLNINHVMQAGISGNFAEVGVWRGNTAAVLAHYAHRYGRRVYLFDTFSGFDPKDVVGIDASQPVAKFSDTSIQMVKNAIGQESAVCEFAQGYFPSTVLAAHRESSYAVVSLDCDLYEPTKAGLEFFYPRMSRGGIFLLHDYSSGYWAGSKKAIDEFCAETGELLILMPDKSGSAFVRKST